MFSLFRRSSYSRLNEEKIIENYLEKVTPPNNFIVDLGAGDGIKMSNTYRLFKKEYPGVAVEVNATKFQQLTSNYSALRQVEKINKKVLPDNIAQLLESVNTPKDFLLLDLDIDGFDYFVLEAILKSYTPILIITEINESIPPPIKFKVLPDENFEWRGGHFFGYSIACLDEIMGAFDYSLAELHYNNAILVSNSYWNGESLTTKGAYLKGYWQKSNRRRKFRYNRDLEYLFDLMPQQMIDHLADHFKEHKNQYQISY